MFCITIAYDRLQGTMNTALAFRGVISSLGCLVVMYSVGKALDVRKCSDGAWNFGKEFLLIKTLVLFVCIQSNVSFLISSKKNKLLFSSEMIYEILYVLILNIARRPELCRRKSTGAFLPVPLLVQPGGLGRQCEVSLDLL